MRAGHPFAAALKSERDGTVRAVIYEAVGRARPVTNDAETLLREGLADQMVPARAGAARGLESMFRLNRRTLKPSEPTLAALRTAFAQNSGEELRVLVLLTLNAAAGSDAPTNALALRDGSAQVRRLGVMASQTWTADASPMVRLEALKFLNDCSQIAAAVTDPSDHVSLAAIDRLGARRCSTTLIEPIATGGRSWRAKAQGLLALIAADSGRAPMAIAALAKDTIWQVRAKAAAPAIAIRDSVTLATLARDANPNVALTALRTSDDLQRAVRSDHAGLALAAAGALKGSPLLPTILPRLVSAFNRLTADGSMTMRDPRVELLTRIGETADTTTNAMLRETLYDRDPAVAAVAAKILTARTGTTVAPGTTRLPIPPIPPAAYIRGLSGATVHITMRGLGTMTLALLPEEAPVTVGVFAQLAESGQYNGLTFHRIVPNFVIQGGSPGADEFDGRTREFMRDEVGMTRNARGTIGISTRGRDTGDGQIYLNLVDNFRLDRDYTVLARMLDGLDVMDRVQEGDVIERIEIIRTAVARRVP